MSAEGGRSNWSAGPAAASNRQAWAVGRDATSWPRKPRCCFISGAFGFGLFLGFRFQRAQATPSFPYSAPRQAIGETAPAGHRRRHRSPGLGGQFGVGTDLWRKAPPARPAATPCSHHSPSAAGDIAACSPRRGGAVFAWPNRWYTAAMTDCAMSSSGSQSLDRAATETVSHGQSFPNRSSHILWYQMLITYHMPRDPQSIRQAASRSRTPSRVEIIVNRSNLNRFYAKNR